MGEQNPILRRKGETEKRKTIFKRVDRGLVRGVC
jgi:hypothetical protein